MAAPVVDGDYLKHIEGARKDLRTLISTKQCAPIILRLAFHDAGTYDAKTKKGGPNGTVRFELNNPANNGIKVGVDLVEQVKVKHPKVTYADLYQLAGVVAVEATGGPVIHYVPGRPDAQQVDNGSLPLPSGGLVLDMEKVVLGLLESHNFSPLIPVSWCRMGLSDRDIVVLSGAHTLGRANRDRSGVDGPFTRNPLKFDNSYYVELMKGDTPDLVKFNTDKILTQDPIFRKFVQLYAKDEKAFLTHYAESHKKMSELGKPK